MESSSKRCASQSDESRVMLMFVFRMRSRSWTSVLAGALVALLAAAPARAQYFGQNKVRYENPRSQVLKTQHFDIYYSPDEAAIVGDAGRIAEDWYGRLSKTL